MSNFILCLEILFVIAFFVIGIFKRTLIDRKTFWFSVPVFVIGLIIYSYAYFTTNGFYNVLSFAKCAGLSLGAFGLSIAENLLIPLFENDIIFKIDVYVYTIIAGTTMISSLIGFFKISIRNYISVFILKMKNADIVVGYNGDALTYCRNNKNSIIFIDSKTVKLTAEQKRDLFFEKIPFIYLPFNAKGLKSIKFLHGTTNVIIFDEDLSSTHVVCELLDGIKTSKNRQFSFSIEIPEESQAFVNDELSIRCNKNEYVKATTFDRYDLLARNFSLKHNLAKYLPDGFLEDALLKKDKQINVNFIGFGKTAYATMKSLIINNQFIVKDGEKYKCMPINYYLYDKDKKNLERPLFARIKNLYTNIYDLPLPDFPAIITPKDINVKSDFEEIKYLFDDNKDVFNYYFVSLQSDIENASVAKQISQIVSKNSLIFYNVDSKKEAILSLPNVLPYGFKDEILTHDTIVNDELGLLAELNHKGYLSLKGTNDKMDENIERRSNIQAYVNVGFKLNLIGLNYTKKEDAIGISKREFSEKYGEIVKDYGKYFVLNTRNALAYQEHLRWTTFYIVNGFRPLRFKEITFNGEKVVHKDLTNKKHACLLSFYDLDKLYKHELEVYKNNGCDKNIKDIETNSYDYAIMDGVYETLSQFGYKITKLTR